MIRKALLICLMIGIFFALGSSMLFAQKSQNNKGLSVTPYSFTFDLKPGEKRTDTVYLSNLTNQPLDIKVEARNFQASGEEGDVTLTTDTAHYALSSWINVEPTRVSIPAGSIKVPFSFTISTPPDPEPGGHFGAIIFSTVPAKDLKTSGAVVSQEVGSLLFVTTPGDIKEDASILSFSPEKPFYEFGPVTFLLRVKNNSTIHIHPVGDITITDMLGNKTEIPLDSQNVLPGATRRMTAQLNRNLLFGHYTARLTASYGISNKAFTASTTFNAFPVRYGLAALGVLALIVGPTVLITLIIIRKSKK